MILAKFALGIDIFCRHYFGHNAVDRGGGNTAYERGGNARQKFCIKPLKETDLGMAQAFFDP